MKKETKRSIIRIKENKTKKFAGIHLIAEFWYGKEIKTKKEAERILKNSVKEARATALEIVIHKFNPQGLTGVILLAESHIAVHSWPELNYTAIDIFTCGDKSSADKALEYFKRELNPKKVKVIKIKRGMVKL